MKDLTREELAKYIQKAMESTSVKLENDAFLKLLAMIDRRDKAIETMREGLTEIREQSIWAKDVTAREVIAKTETILKEGLE